ncbi:MAG: hypothetical protein JWM76_5128 [Pseudonocardiales bacterium]|nr:hypothetical protein [Pseudonocardiales bacterium]
MTTASILTRPNYGQRHGIGGSVDRPFAGRLLRGVAATLGEPTVLPIFGDERLCDPAMVDYVARCARYHNILPLLWMAMQQNQHSDQLRVATLSLYRPAVGHALRLHQALRGIVVALTEAGVPFAVFKGPALSWRYYRSPQDRFSSDVDILITAHALRLARPALIKAGFVGPLAPPSDRAPGNAETSYRLPGYGIADVHWHIMREVRVRRAFSIDTTAMLNRVQFIDMDDLAVPILDDADAAIAVATHACFDGAYRLGWLVDLARVLRRVDSRDLRGRCVEVGAVLPVAVMADRMQITLGEPAPALGMSHSIWRQILRAVARVRPAQQSFQQPLRASVMYRATQASSVTSLIELARLLRTESLPELSSSGHRLRQPHYRRDGSDRA